MSGDFPERFRTDVLIIQETVNQIKKDFNNIEIVLTGNAELAFDEIRRQIIPLIKKMHSGDKHGFQTLLYRVDVSEKDFQLVLSKSNSTEFYDDVAEMIIRREFQKVLTRKYFSG